MQRYTQGYYATRDSDGMCHLMPQRHLPEWTDEDEQAFVHRGSWIAKYGLDNTASHCQLHLQEVAINPKRAGGGAESAPPRHFLLYLSRLLFFRAETSWLFFLEALRSF